MRYEKGFTLIELMMVVAIIAILSAIAIPSYADYIRRGKITEAVSSLSDIRVRQEQYFQDNRTYANGADCGAVATATANFSFSCSASTATAYVATATGIGSMQGFVYTVDQSNARSTTITGVSGWIGSNSCWIVNKGGAC